MCLRGASDPADDRMELNCNQVTREDLVAAYIIGFYDIVNWDAFRDYFPGVIPLLQKHGAEVLVADYETQALEGHNPSTCVVLKFQSEEEALAWYNDPEYAPIRKIRIDASRNTTLVLAK